MKIIVFGDVHGNIDAFEAMVNATKDADLYICLGDIVNYCPFSNECVDLLEDLPYAIRIKGNHEDAFISGSYNGKNEIAKAFFESAYQNFTRFSEIKEYVDSYENFGYEFVHTLNNEYIYADSTIEFSRNYMIAHSHRQYVIKYKDNILYNPGSIGQNRVNIEKGEYLIFYPDKNKVELEYIDINIERVLNEMKIRNYPNICIDYFNSKRKRN